jgi:hypothetical protein
MTQSIQNSINQCYLEAVAIHSLDTENPTYLQEALKITLIAFRALSCLCLEVIGDLVNLGFHLFTHEEFEPIQHRFAFIFQTVFTPPTKDDILSARAKLVLHNPSFSNDQIKENFHLDSGIGCVNFETSSRVFREQSSRLSVELLDGITLLELIENPLNAPFPKNFLAQHVSSLNFSIDHLKETTVSREQIERVKIYLKDRFETSFFNTGILKHVEDAEIKEILQTLLESELVSVRTLYDNIQTKAAALNAYYDAFLACKDALAGQSGEQKNKYEELNLETLDLFAKEYSISPAIKEVLLDWIIQESIYSLKADLPRRNITYRIGEKTILPFTAHTRKTPISLYIHDIYTSLLSHIQSLHPDWTQEKVEKETVYLLYTPTQTFDANYMLMTPFNSKSQEQFTRLLYTYGLDSLTLNSRAQAGANGKTKDCITIGFDTAGFSTFERTADRSNRLYLDSETGEMIQYENSYDFHQSFRIENGKCVGTTTTHIHPLIVE